MYVYFVIQYQCACVCVKEKPEFIGFSKAFQGRDWDTYNFRLKLRGVRSS